MPPELASPRRAAAPPLGTLLLYMQSKQAGSMNHAIGVSTLLRERGGCPKASKKASPKCKHRAKPPSSADFDSLITVCDACGAHRRLMPKCTGCRRVRYCNRVCQRSSWRLGFHRCARITEATVDGEFSYHFAASHFISTERLCSFEPIVTAIFQEYMSYYNYCRIVTEWSRSYLESKDATAIEVAREAASPTGVAQLVCSHPTTLYVRAPTMRCAIAQWAVEIIDAVRILFEVQVYNELPAHPPLFWRDVGVQSSLRWDLRNSADNVDTRCQHIITTYKNEKIDNEEVCVGIDVRLVGGHDDESTLMHIDIQPLGDDADAVRSSLEIFSFWQRNKCIYHDAELGASMARVDTNDVLVSTIRAMHTARITAIELVDAQKDLDIFTRDALIGRECECECDDELEAINFLASPNVERVRMISLRIRTECGILEILAISIRQNELHCIDADLNLADDNVVNASRFTFQSPYLGMSASTKLF